MDNYKATSARLSSGGKASFSKTYHPELFVEKCSIAYDNQNFSPMPRQNSRPQPHLRIFGALIADRKRDPEETRTPNQPRCF